MLRFTVRRLAYAVVTLWVIATITFFLMHLLPGQPFNHPDKLNPAIAMNLKHKYGLDKPLYIQYFIYLTHLLQGDLGLSIRYEGRTVNALIAQGFPVSALLGGEALLFALIPGIVLGIVAALKQNTWLDRTVMSLSVFGISVPNIVLGPLLSYYVGVKLGWLPPGAWRGFRYTILPAITLGMLPLAFIARMMRTSMLDVLSMDHLLTARAKGLSNWVIVWRHMLRNALVPVVTMMGPLTVNILTGSFVVEETFAVPGLGESFVQSIVDNDYSVIMGATIFYSALYIGTMFLVDIAYGWLDPRMRLAVGRYRHE